MPAPGNPPSLALAGIPDGLFRLSDPVRLAQDTRAGSTRDSVKNEPDLIEKLVWLMSCAHLLTMILPQLELFSRSKSLAPKLRALCLQNSHGDHFMSKQ
ncbi:hypothetical protein MCOR28_008639 [Pyricularia oryzae]|nr:hypothetical protein MCOR28_008639 [Pyricularia oryzae]KAI6441882.1 hypothetical protein MCOR15_011548 [Pyricularia oryzae]KAI6574569.1 hypothetical protein MCOR06_011408 [Pyricularia oryzae]KAI6581380.1 hypothetical protein MCOR12_011425 [Pyricularia oryzae]